jgi:hypothetical protein
MDNKPELQFLPGRYAVGRMDRRSTVPIWAMQGGFYSVTRTADELSIVCDERLMPDGVTCVKGYIALKMLGPLDFSLTGILAAISAVLAEAKVSIFALSTYDTDYILIRERDKAAAVKALTEAGYVVHA